MKRTLLKRFCAITCLLALCFWGPESGVRGSEKDMQKGAKAGAAKPLTEEQRLFHLLNRITFGPRLGDLDRVKRMGWEKFLEEQLHPDRISDDVVEAKLKTIESIHLSNEELAKYYPPGNVVREILKAKGTEMPGAAGDAEPNPEQRAETMKKRREAAAALQEMGYKAPQQAIQELQQAKILRAVYSERQLQEVMTDFWFNHFNVFIQKGADRILTTSYERDVIRPRVFGKFEDLLKATAKSPAMLFYLDNFMSAAPEGAETMAPPTRRRLRRDAQMTPALNAKGKLQRPRRGLNENYAREIMELHTLGVDGGYSQKDVQEVARCFTGWTLRNPRGGAEFVFNPRMHDDGEKLVLGKKISAGGGENDGYAVIHLLATHPATAKFISTKLARRFVADNPPPALIEKMTQTYRKTDGDIREVLRTLFTSREFWAAENYRAKIKTPFEMTVSAVRATGAETNASPPFHRWISQMGEGLYMAQPPTGYPDTAEHWVNTGALLERMNFSLALAANRIPGTRVNLTAPANESGQIVDWYLKSLLRGEVSPETRATIDKNLKEEPLARNEAQVAKIVGLILGSPEFQRQ